MIARLWRRIVRNWTADDAVSAMLTRQDRTAPDGTYRPTWRPPVPRDVWSDDPDRTTRRGIV